MSQLLRNHSWAILSVSIVLLIGFLGMLRAAEAWNVVTRLQQEGVRTQAQVVALRDTLPLARSFYVTTTYRLDGETYTRENRIQREVYDTLSAGDPFTLLVDPDSPDVALPPGNRLGAINLTITSAVWLVGGVAAGAYYAITVRRLRRAQARSAALWDEAAEHIARAAEEIRQEAAQRREEDEE
jgi:hypothetical protein